MKPYPIAQIERVSRNLLMMGSVIFGISVLGFASSWNEFRVLCLGPTPATFENFAEQVSQFVEIRGDRVIDTGFTHAEEGKASPALNRQTAKYVVLAQGEKLLLIRAHTPGGTTFRGRLLDLPQEQRQEVIGALEVEFPHLKGAFVPYYLEQGGASLATTGAFFAILAFLVLGFGLMYRGARGLEEPLHHSSLRPLRRRGAAGELVQEIDREMLTDAKLSRYGSVILTKSWLIHASRFSFSVVYLPDLAWVYRKRPGLLALNAARSVVFYDLHNNYAEISESEINTERVFAEAILRAPWAVTAYNRNLDLLWSTDRRAFLEEVLARRQKGTSAA